MTRFVFRFGSGVSRRDVLRSARQMDLLNMRKRSPKERSFGETGDSASPGSFASARPDAAPDAEPVSGFVLIREMPGFAPPATGTFAGDPPLDPSLLESGDPRAERAAAAASAAMRASIAAFALVGEEDDI